MNRLAHLRRHISPATLIALVALFVALGGSSYAVLTINGSQIRDRSISGRKLKKNTLGGTTIKESRLGRVRRARRADRLGGLSAGDLKVHCPGGTTFVSGVCAERGVRPATAYGFARIECDSVGRRLPTYEELANLVSGADISVASPEELTSSVYFNQNNLMVVTVKDEAGIAGHVTDTGGGARPFRCVAYPSN